MTKPKLYNRFLEYLISVHKMNPEVWVEKKSMKDLAFKHNYKSDTVWGAFEKLEENVRIGKIYDGDTKYIYYDLPDKLVKDLEHDIKRFNEM